MSAELVAQRKRLVDEWNAWRIRCREEMPASFRKKLAGDGRKKKEEEEKEEIEVWIDEVVEQIEEEVLE